jgi:nucleoside-diphosphate-sugar epimerase
MSSIGILGGGWLGSALAAKAIEKDHRVKITTTTPEKTTPFNKKGFNTHLLKVGESGIEGELDFFKDIDFLVITIPPGLRRNPERNYVSLVKQIILKIELFEIKKVLFTSSTGVYGFQEGVISEASELLGNTSSAQQIIEVEHKLLENKKFESSIVRLGGLMGPDRHPITTLSGKKNLPNPLSPINFIHQKDAVAIILQLIEKWTGNQVYNAVSPFHPSRKEYYEQMAKLAKLSPPTFEKTGTKRGIISTEKVVSELKYQFIVKNLLILN